MAKPRSPDYPAIGLDEAIEKVRMIWTKDYQNKVPKKVIAEHMGYKGLNGGSLPVISALSKYGLLEGRGDETKVTDLALAILAHAPGTAERAVAVRQAAAVPELFAELDGKFPGGKASDAAIRSYLLTQKFIPSGADAAIRSYRDTKQLVEAESQGHTEGVQSTEALRMPDRHQAPLAPPAPPLTSVGVGATPYNTTWTPASGGEPFRVSFTGAGIEVAANLTSPEVADDLVRAINALKLLLRPTNTVARPQEEQTQAPPIASQQRQDGIPFMITQAQKAKLRELGHSEEAIRDMTPQYAHDLLQAMG